MYDVCMTLTYNVLIIITWENNWIYMYLSISTKHISNTIFFKDKYWSLVGRFKITISNFM